MILMLPKQCTVRAYSLLIVNAYNFKLSLMYRTQLLLSLHLHWYLLLRGPTLPRRVVSPPLRRLLRRHHTRRVVLARGTRMIRHLHFRYHLLCLHEFLLVLPRFRQCLLRETEQCEILRVVLSTRFSYTVHSIIYEVK